MAREPPDTAVADLPNRRGLVLFTRRVRRETPLSGKLYYRLDAVSFLVDIGESGGWTAGHPADLSLGQ